MGSVFLWPPMYASSSLVLLPTKAADPDQMAEQVKTDIRIAKSDSVLAPAARSLRPRMSVEALARHVEVDGRDAARPGDHGAARRSPGAPRTSPGQWRMRTSAYVTESSSSLSNARRALLTAREKELKETLEKIGGADSRDHSPAPRRGTAEPPGQGRCDSIGEADRGTGQARSFSVDELQGETEEVVQPSGGASIIQEPSPAKRAGLVGRYLGHTMAGVLVALLLAVGVITLLTRRDPRLHFRDDIADAVGSPVIASVHTRTARSVAEWTSLLRDYAPGTVDAWAWRRSLRHISCLPRKPASASEGGWTTPGRSP